MSSEGLLGSAFYCQQSQYEMSLLKLNIDSRQKRTEHYRLLAPENKITVAKKTKTPLLESGITI